MFDVSLIAACKSSTELLSLLNVPALRSRSWEILKVLPVTSSAPAVPTVRLSEKDRVPPVEEMDPDESYNALPRVKFTFFVSMA